MKCSLCEAQDEEESEMHLFRCSKIMNKIGCKDDFENVCLDDIFSDNLDKQVSFVKLFNKVLKTRNYLMNV